jgi:hypothetical protein
MALVIMLHSLAVAMERANVSREFALSVAVDDVLHFGNREDAVVHTEHSAGGVSTCRDLVLPDPR